MRRALAILLLSAACGGDTAVHAPDYLTRLREEEDLASLSAAPDPVAVKYLLRAEGAAPFSPLDAPCTFQNTRRYPWHLQFLQSLPGHSDLSYAAYRDLVVRAGRLLWGGTLEERPDAVHPQSGVRGVVSFVVYADTNGLDVDGVVEVDRILKSCAPFLADELVFLPELPDQVSFLKRERAALAQRGVAALLPEELMADDDDN